MVLTVTSPAESLVPAREAVGKEHQLTSSEQVTNGQQRDSELTRIVSSEGHHLTAGGESKLIHIVRRYGTQNRAGGHGVT